MPDYVIAPPRLPAAPVEGTDKHFPIRRVYCIGRNYAAHAVEMGGDPVREPPFFFQKNADNLDFSGVFPYPPGTADVHHEIEMAVALRSGGVDIDVEDALDHVFGYAVALDMTRRDLQTRAKEAGRPWEVAKAFERSAPMSPLRPVAQAGHPAAGSLVLNVNGRVRQVGALEQMVWKVPEIIAALSRHFELSGGDVILTGTPSGVGSVAPGDVLEATIEGVGFLTVLVTGNGMPDAVKAKPGPSGRFS